MDSGMNFVLGWFLIILLSAVIVWIGWFQWNAYRTLDQKIEMMDSSLIYGASTRVEKILDAPQGSIVVPYMMAGVVPVQNVGVNPVAVSGPRYDDFSSVRSVDGQIRK
jgi:hypothetical protein